MTNIFDKEVWKKYLPKKLTIVTDNGSFNLLFSEVSIIGNVNIAQIVYHQNTFKHDKLNGEPDYLEFDVHLVQDNDGTKALSDLKLNIDITYGDAMVSEFTVKMPGNIEIIHYTGLGSKYDKETFFGFEDQSIKDLVNFFNRLGFELEPTETIHNMKYIKTYNIFRLN
jgi:hypothetical protein